MKINLEFNGTADEIMKEFQALGSILSSAALPSDVKPLDPETLSPDLGSVEQHPKVDAVPENATSAPKKAAKAPKKATTATESATTATESATIAPTPEPVKAAEPAAPGAPEPPAAPTVPTAPTKKYTLDELLAATAPLMDAGKISELQALMQKFSVPSMMEIPEDRYGELATALRELGAEL